MDDLISRRKAIDAMGKAKWAKERLMELPSVQPEDVVGIINDSVDNALTLLDPIYSSGRMMYYSDYCALHDAIAGAVSGR